MDLWMCVFRIFVYRILRNCVLCLLWHVILDDFGDVRRMCGPDI